MEATATLARGSDGEATGVAGVRHSGEAMSGTAARPLRRASNTERGGSASKDRRKDRVPNVKI